jgi:hypothetical protein
MQQAASQIASELLEGPSGATTSSSVFMPGSTVGGVSLQTMLPNVPQSALSSVLGAVESAPQQHQDKSAKKRRMPSVALALVDGNEEGDEEMQGDELSGDNDKDVGDQLFGRTRARKRPSSGQGQVDKDGGEVESGKRAKKQTKQHESESKK